MKQAIVLSVLALVACSPEAPLPPNPSVYFIEPAEDAHVITPVKVRIGVEDIVLERPGRVTPNHGHIVVQIGECSLPGTVVPRDEKHVHLDDGGTETLLDLGLGLFVLCAQLVDGAYVAQPPADVVEIWTEPY